MIGFDVGTYNLVSCRRDKDKNFATRREVNAFLEMQSNEGFVFNMMKSVGVPLIERGERFYALGEAAVQMAYSMPQVELKRPMIDGCVNPKEKDAFDLMAIMMHGLLGDISKDGETLCYSVPANAINDHTDADYHGKLLQAIFDSYESKDGYKVKASPINEALAIVYAELAHKHYTGLSASFGSGMVNVCFAIFGSPIFEFAIVNSGDWIDKQAARATGESVTFINKEKTKVDLIGEPATLVERAIQTQYRIMIEKTVANIKKGLEDAGKRARADGGVDMVVAGGTSLPNGFDVLFKQVLAQAELPIKINNVTRPKDPLYSVARGCLLAAENQGG